MFNNLEKITAELRGLGIETSSFNSPKGDVVAFPYRIDIGTREGQEILIGLSMQGNELYPEYPPHWIHIFPSVDDRRGGVVEFYTDDNGRQWSVLSRPPGALWDKLPTKHMSHFLSDHIRRFWDGI